MSACDGLWENQLVADGECRGWEVFGEIPESPNGEVACRLRVTRAHVCRGDLQELFVSVLSVSNDSCNSPHHYGEYRFVERQECVPVG